MIVLGPGGTGKSLLIGAVTETFEYYAASNRLAKCATTGIAAADIGGKTLHSLICIGRGQAKENWLTKSSAKIQERRRINLQEKDFLIIDEISMADKATFCCASQAFAHVRAEYGTENVHAPFGGAHVMLFGDFHQFPPVGNQTGALYRESSNDKLHAKLGQSAFRQFDTIVMLTEQKRVLDPIWLGLLGRLRTGECTTQDLDEVNKLAVNDPSLPTDYTKPPWSEATLITQRHSVRERWNEAAIRKHCASSSETRFIVAAEDTLRNSDDDVPMDAKLAIAGLNDSKKGKLADQTTLAIGMKAMVIMNIATEADLANGTRGTIVDVVLDPREPELTANNDGGVTLKFPPSAVVFKPDGKSTIKYNAQLGGSDVDEGLIPIIPSTTTFTVNINKNSYEIRRRQFAITAGYAFTDYKSQGQTIEYVIIDLAPPPSGQTSPFSTYVALSRSRGRDTIRILREFEKDTFLNHPSEHLRKEMDRLETMSRRSCKDIAM